eukprot:356443-Chlamydomonas_euryale.AAC.4
MEIMEADSAAVPPLCAKRRLDFGSLNQAGRVGRDMGTRESPTQQATHLHPPLRRADSDADGATACASDAAQQAVQQPRPALSACADGGRKRPRDTLSDDASTPRVHPVALASPKALHELRNQQQQQQQRQQQQQQQQHRELEQRHQELRDQSSEEAASSPVGAPRRAAADSDAATIALLDHCAGITAPRPRCLPVRPAAPNAQQPTHQLAAAQAADESGTAAAAATVATMLLSFAACSGAGDGPATAAATAQLAAPCGFYPKQPAAYASTPRARIHPTPPFAFSPSRDVQQQQQPSEAETRALQSAAAAPAPTEVCAPVVLDQCQPCTPR